MTIHLMCVRCGKPCPVRRMAEVSCACPCHFGMGPCRHQPLTGTTKLDEPKKEQ